jgi:hypothetical protein
MAPVKVVSDSTTKTKEASSARKTGMWRYGVSVRGISAMLQNPMTEDTLDTLLHGSGCKRKSANKDIKPEDIALKRLCLGPNGEFGIPANYLFASLVTAGRHVIFDKKTKMSTADSSLVPAFLSIAPELINENGDGFIPFTDQDHKYVVDKRKGNLKSGAGKGVAVAIVRPKFMEWAFNVKIDVDHDQIDIDKIKDLFLAAGRYSGLGDFRPSCKGQFGRFKVVKFAEIEQVIDQDEAEAA